MSASLRRSGRRAITKNSFYNVGDVVEVVRNEISYKGKLLQELSEGKTANPRWLVAFVNQPTWKDEELYERVFGRKYPDEEPVIAQKPIHVQTKPESPLPPKKRSRESVKEESSSEESRGKQKTVSFTAEESGSDSSLKDTTSAAAKAKAAARASAREQRSLRRQAHVGPEIGILPPPPPVVKRSAPTLNLPNNNKKSRKEEEVVKVPMLTGTLFLYRGPVRRAEFVRRF